MVNFDLTITLGTIIETAVLGCGGVAALVTLRNTVASLKTEAAAAKKMTPRIGSTASKPNSRRWATS